MSHHDKKLESVLSNIRKAAASTFSVEAVNADKAAVFPHKSIDALKCEKLFSCMIPKELGGFGFSITQTATICNIIGEYCASTALIFSMHQIQIETIVRYARRVPFFKKFLTDIAQHQLLLASATTERDTGGDISVSNCGLRYDAGGLNFVKDSPIVSYAEQADAILVTCRQSPQAAQSNQSLVLVKSGQYKLQKTSDWDTMGFRGTCSSGYLITACADVEQVFPVPFNTVLRESVHPVSHLLWCAVWIGMAMGVVKKAKFYLNRKPISDVVVKNQSTAELVKIDAILQLMINNHAFLLQRYQLMLMGGFPEDMTDFTMRYNELKISTSSFLVEITQRSMLICGMEAYKNNSAFSLSRELRDAYGSVLMISNNRLINTNLMMSNLG